MRKWRKTDKGKQLQSKWDEERKQKTLELRKQGLCLCGEFLYKNLTKCLHCSLLQAQACRKYHGKYSVEGRKQLQSQAHSKAGHLD